MTSLDDALLADGPDLEQPETRERWQIESDELAGWALRKLAAIQAEIARLKQQAASEIARIRTWEDDATRAAGHDADFFRSRLTDYRRRLEQANPKLPLSYKLPTGVLKRNNGQPSTKVFDRDSFIGWALDNAPETIKYDPLVSKMADWPRTDKDGVTYIVEPVSGQVVPGVEVVIGDDTYDAKPAVGAFE